MTDASTSDPTLLVIHFRLVPLGSNRLLHAAFRRECVLHTPLFAGFPGFRSKLWVDDVETGVYRGIYQWQGGDLARHYAQRMVGLLAPFSNAGTARHQLRRVCAATSFCRARTLSRRRTTATGGNSPSRSRPEMAPLPA